MPGILKVFFSNMSKYSSREEKLLIRNEVVNMLKEFSLGKQEDLRGKIKALNIPILWIAGEKMPNLLRLLRKCTN